MTDVQVWWSSLVAAGRGLLEVLDDAERDRVASLQHPADQARSMVGAALLRVAVGAHRGLPPAAVVVDRTCAECGGPHGAPRVVGPDGDGPWVSVSHSGLLVVVALSPSRPVGVDVQRVSDLADAADAAGWARREAETKARAWGAGPVSLRPLEPPRDGYAAALALRAHPADLTDHGAEAPADVAVVVREWSGTG